MLTLLGSSPNWKEEYTTVFGTEWSYEDALTSKIYEGFLEAGPQAIFQLYVQMTFTWMEQVQCVALFTSVITILLASVKWNFIGQVKADNLPLLQKLKVVPFFTAPILMKMFVTSSLAFLCSTTLKLGYLQMTMIGTTVLVIMLGLHLVACYQPSIHCSKQFPFISLEPSTITSGREFSLVMTSIASLSTTANPDVSGRITDVDFKVRFFIYETRISAVSWGVLSLINLCFAINGNKQEDLWVAWTCLGLVALHCVVRQTYLLTARGKAWLCPKTDEPSANLSQQHCQCLLTCLNICKKQGDDCEDQSTPLSPRPLTKKKRKNIGCILFVASIAFAIAIPIILWTNTGRVPISPDNWSDSENKVRVFSCDHPKQAFKISATNATKVFLIHSCLDLQVTIESESGAGKAT